MAVRRTGLLLIALALTDWSARAADRVVLRDGFEMVGDVEKLEQRILVRSGPRIYLLGVKQIQQARRAADVEPPIRLTLPPPPPPTGKVLESISGVRSIGEFDEFGRRTCVVVDGVGGEVTVQQQATEIYPTHVVLVGLNRAWLTNAALSRIPAKPLLAMLRRAIDPAAAADRLKVVRLLLQAERFSEARTELQQVQQQFPDAREKTEPLQQALEESVAARALTLAQRAAEVGQVARAKKLLDSLGAAKTSAELESRIAEFRNSVLEKDQLVETTRRLLRSTQKKAEGRDDLEQGTIDRALEEIASLASSASVDRLEPFRSLTEQPTTTSTERAALAISGWVLGDALAVKDSAAAARSWRQAEILRRSLLADTQEVPGLLVEFRKAGGDAALAAAMAPRLTAPPLPESKGAAALTFELKIRDRAPLRYHALVPPEYDRTREYPAIVTLHDQAGAPARQLEMWGASAGENGVVVIAPEYIADAAAGYRFSTDEHFAILAMLSDAKRRLAIDSERIFLSGHGMGGYAAWDVGMSHPDQFAGLIPVSGSPAGVCKHYAPNLKHLAVFTIDGSIAHSTATPTETLVTRWQALGHNLVYSIYPGRGPESFVGEFPVVFDWMRRQRRPSRPAEVEAASARPFDRRFYWMEIDSLSPSAATAPELVDQTKVRPARLTGKVQGGDSIQVNVGGVETLSLLLPPQLVQMDNPNLTIRVNRRLVHRGLLQADLETMVREMRRTGDRRLVVARRLEVKGLLPRRQ